VFKLAIPVLHVGSSASAEELYCGRLGFRRDFAYRLDDAQADPCYMGLTRDGVEVHVSSFSGDAVAGNCSTLATRNLTVALLAEYRDPRRCLLVDG
jgi:hypothetical protein